MRRKSAEHRPITPDPRYNSVVVARFINNVMERGKKSLASRIVYGAFEIMEERTKRPPLEVFEEALKNATPLVEVKPRRVGGSTYQVPVEIGANRQTAIMTIIVGLPVPVMSFANLWMAKSGRWRGP